MTTNRWVRAQTLDEDGNVIGGLTGRDGSYLTDADLDAWVDAFAVPEAEAPMPAARRRGRPNVTGASEGESPRITVRLSAAEIQALDELAGVAGTTRADLARLAVAEYLKRASGAVERLTRLSSQEKPSRRTTHSAAKMPPAAHATGKRLRSVAKLGTLAVEPPTSSQQIRQWARENKVAVHSKGRLPAHVVAAYERSLK